MNLSIVNGSAVKSELYSGNIDFDTVGGADTFYAILVREGFTFSSSYYKYLKNLHATSGALVGSAISIDATQRSFTRASGSFIDDGFCVGNHITCTGATGHAEGTYKITSVTALVIRVSIVTGSLTSYTYVANPVHTHTITITSNDELATAASPYVYTMSNPITGPVLPAMEVTFTVDGETLYLDPFALGDIITLTPPDIITDYSPGLVIYDGTATSKPIICYATFSPWTLQF